MSTYVHPTAIIELGVLLGDGCAIWDSVHIRRNTTIGPHCIVGEKTHISYEVRIGALVKINAFVYICTGVTLENGVMVSAGCIFANDDFPRSTNPEVTALRDSGPDHHTLPTIVREGATLGAGTRVRGGIEIGRFAMVGMASMVTRSIPDFHLAIGSPARSVGYVCRCGEPLIKFDAQAPSEWSGSCAVCQRTYASTDGAVTEVG